MPLQQTSGNATTDAYGGGVAAVPNYIEDVFSTYLVTGDGTAPAVNNGIDVSGEGGLVWTKKRSAAGSHSLFDTARGANLRLISNDTAAQDSVNLSFTTTGFSNYTFDSGVTYASWTFRKQPKFFDVVTFTATRSGSGWSGGPVVVNHSLGSTPGSVMWKAVDNTSNWYVNHRSLGNQYRSFLNTTDASVDTGIANYINPTSTNVTFSNATCGIVGDGVTVTIVVYLFADNAGGFGLTGTDNVISCGSYTGNGSTNGPTVNLGYEPQWILVKNASGANPWNMDDNMRGWETGGLVQNLQANASYAESQQGPALALNSTGFKVVSNDSDWNGTSATYIYIAIRRGPMKVPTSGTSVFYPTTYTGTGANNTITGFGFPPDLVLPTSTDGFSGYGTAFADKLRGPYQTLKSNSTSSEDTITNGLLSFDQNGISVGPDNAVGYINWNTKPYVFWNFRRAPSFFDEVCWTPNGSANDRITHNLGVPPELIITKTRSPSAGDNWWTYSSSLGRSSYLALNTTDAASSLTDVWGTSNPTSTDFGMKDTAFGYDSTYREVAYLFATCAGVSKVGSYTGNGSTQTIDCGFGAGGARFVLIKRTDSTGGWYVYDTARGMTTLTDPYLLLNSTAAESATLGSVTTVSTGFALDATILAAINTNAASYIFLAIA